MDCGSAFLHGLFLQDTQNMQGAGVDITYDTGTVAARAGNVRTLVEGRA